MKYLLIEYVDPDNPCIITKEGSTEPLIITPTYPIVENFNKIKKEYTHKGIFVPVCDDLIEILCKTYDFIYNQKDIHGEDIDIGESGLENEEDCLERRIGKFTSYER